MQLGRGGRLLQQENGIVIVNGNTHMSHTSYQDTVCQAIVYQDIHRAPVLECVHQAMCLVHESLYQIVSYTSLPGLPGHILS